MMQEGDPDEYLDILLEGKVEVIKTLGAPDKVLYNAMLL